MSSIDENPLQPLGADAQARWDTLKDAVTELAGATGDNDEFAAAWAAMRQAGSQFDSQEVLNALHVPADAGEYEDSLRGMLARIPDGWGRWISCSRGWYPLLADLDEQLRALFPAYVIHQVKEKYGGARFYWEPNESVTDPAIPEPATPERDADEATWEAWHDAHDAWSERQDAYRDTPDGGARQADLDRRLALAEELEAAAEVRAEHTCELCGQPGELCCTRAQSAWYQTLCPACMTAREYMPARERAAWWEAEKPHYEARQRAAFMATHAQSRAAVITADDTLRVCLPDATYIHAPERARAAANEPWELVFLGDDATAAAYATALRERSSAHEQNMVADREQRPAEGKAQTSRRPDGAPDIYWLGASGQTGKTLSAFGLRGWQGRPDILAGPVE